MRAELLDRCSSLLGGVRLPRVSELLDFRGLGGEV
jgi:hypothetical protein